MATTQLDCHIEATKQNRDHFNYMSTMERWNLTVRYQDLCQRYHIDPPPEPMTATYLEALLPVLEQKKLEQGKKNADHLDVFHQTIDVMMESLSPSRRQDADSQLHELVNQLGGRQFSDQEVTEITQQVLSFLQQMSA
jgi:hypothetical protein